MSHWIYQDKIIEDLPTGIVGFVYKITNIETGKMYIGRKYATSRKRKALTKAQKISGRKRKDVIVTESNWATYTGSNKYLNSEIEVLGKDKFKFEILYFGKTKGVINYIEETLHHKLDVILNENYYNECIGPRRFMALRYNKELQGLLL